MTRFDSPSDKGICVSSLSVSLKMLRLIAVMGCFENLILLANQLCFII